MLQPKLKVGRVDCPLEREVDSIADSIIRRHATKVAAEGKDYSRCTRVGWDEFLTGEKFYNAHKDGITFWRYSELYTSSVVEWAIDSLASPSSYDDFVARMQKLIDAMHYGLTIMRRVKNADYVEYSDLVNWMHRNLDSTSSVMGCLQLDFDEDVIFIEDDVPMKKRAAILGIFDLRHFIGARRVPA